MDKSTRKTVFQSLTYGLYVLTVKDAARDQIAAATVSWLSQASFSPPLIMVAVKVDSQSHQLLKESQKFAINILQEGQKDLAASFFRPSSIEGNQINGLTFSNGSFSGAPLLDDAPAWLEAKEISRIEHGDHTVIVAEVVEVGVRDNDFTPLAMRTTGWSYGH